MKVRENKIHLRKYWSVYQNALKREIEYKLQLAAMLLRPLIRIVLIAAIWWQIFQLTGKETIAGMDFFMFISYLSLAGLIKVAVLPWDTAEDVKEAIKSGNLLSLLTKPVNYLLFQFSSLMAPSTLGGLYGIVVFLLLSLIGHLLHPQIFFPQNIVMVGLFGISVILGIAISYFFYFMVACTAFWYGDSWSVVGGVVRIQGFLSGELIPLTVSDTLLAVSNFMPFKFMIFTPTFILLEKYTLAEALMQIAGQIIWICIIIAAASLVLQKGIARFEAQGG